ncbi:MAG TPA: GNAT family N-acetyltransferase [Tepidisphaeraceae bacterium]|nr:GNAT family N-acetyltransferase [Tepidisphaeraceae bacterium]
MPSSDAAIARNFALRRATIADVDIVHSIMAETARWLQSRGNDMWQWVLSDDGKSTVRNRIESHETYIISDQQAQPIATFAIQFSDPNIWGERGKDDGKSAYIHGLAVRRCVGGRGLGYELLNIASQMLAERGKTLLRLDCMAENEPLCDYYRKAGFTEVGAVHLNKWNWTSRLFERPINIAK